MSNTRREPKCSGSKVTEFINLYFHSKVRKALTQGQSMNQKLFLGQYKIIDVLGSGAYGTVSLAEDIYTKEKYAIKVINTPGSYYSFVREVSALYLLQQVGASNVVGIRSSADLNIIVMKYYGSNLRNIGNIGSREVRRIAFDILTGIHNNFCVGIMHRDLKPDNILVSDGRAYIGDYGINRYLFAPSSTLTGNMFTIWWRPPEVVSGSTLYDYTADIWSYGIILLELFTGELPFQMLGIGLDKKVSEAEDNDRMMRAIRTLVRVTGPMMPGELSLRNYKARGKLTDDQYELLKSILTIDPRSRPMPYELADFRYFYAFRGAITLTPTKPDLAKLLSNEIQLGMVAYASTVFRQMDRLDKGIPKIIIDEPAMIIRYQALHEVKRRYPDFVRNMWRKHTVITHALYMFDIWMSKQEFIKLEECIVSILGAFFLSTNVLTRDYNVGFSKVPEQIVVAGMKSVFHGISGAYTAIPRRMLGYIIPQIYPEIVEQRPEVVDTYNMTLRQYIVLGVNIANSIDSIIHVICKAESPEITDIVLSDYARLTDIVSRHNYDLPWYK